MKIQAYAAASPKAAFEPFEYEAGELRADDVLVEVEHCGLCHSDLSMLNNDWGRTAYPFVGGHEGVGKIVAIGDHVTHLKVDQHVGVGWFSGSCMHCQECMSGHHNRCGTVEETIVNRHGGFASHVLCKAEWALPIPEALDASKVGPLFCGGLTVFNPLVQNNIRPTQRVGVIGIGGLGHLALQFSNKWGCEVTAFSTSPDKEAEARKLGAHHFVNSKDESALKKIAGSLDMVLVAVNVGLDWSAYLNILRPGGVLHFVGAAPTSEFIPFQLIGGQKSISGSPLGSPATAVDMLEFCARHDLAPVTEHFPLAQINEAFEHLESGKARYRIVLDN
ncbi:NADPH-dependent aldehyde reductase Ahr [Cerasicoccus arenae]|uniref:alcohol dehydrogenase (NADP(+)) n=1 Tax=Cerasicoccus arenae TaxID=424488 RepID=A0A8J3DCD6_9BACT|nr:NAD(P)-dependent alcohol dehydrogenase [Cerasicoccus arenae]MBK1858955.1 NAD(P)-dependent alcohol dehydrogenase [Cerasicoccus arenae]GHC04070.1 alcohol dehydrogenase [Cerasicoccus arenae]